jgi:hypothetical protein
MTQAQVRQSGIGHVRLELKSGGILDERATSAVAHAADRVLNRVFFDVAVTRVPCVSCRVVS